MKTRIAALAFVVLALSVSCRAPLELSDFSPEQAAQIDTLVAAVSDTEVDAVLADLQGPRTNIVPSDVIVADPVLYQDRIVDRFESWGYAVALDPVTWTDTEAWFGDAGIAYTMNNIVVTKTGSDPTLPAVVVCGHWDSVYSSPGMDDNASGAAGVMEIARVLAGVTLERSVVFLLPAYEEVGLVGAFQYAASSSAIDAVINFDMIAYTHPVQTSFLVEDLFLGMPPVGDFIAVFGLYPFRSLAYDFCNAADEFVPALKYYFHVLPENVASAPLLNNTLRSDQLPFWQRDIPAIFVGDTAEFRSTLYHTENDTRDTLDIPFMLNVIRASLATVCVRAGLETP